MKRTLICLICFAFLLASGCGDGRKFPSQYVEGIVTLDNEPLDRSRVSFIPLDQENGNQASAMTDRAGKFKLTSNSGEPGKGALVGDYKVTVSKIQVTNLDTPKRIPGTQITVTSESKQLLPAIYADKEKTPFAATVKKGKNSFTFDLQSKP